MIPRKEKKQTLRCCYTVQCFVQLHCETTCMKHCCVTAKVKPKQVVETVSESRIKFYFLQWFLQLVSQLAPLFSGIFFLVIFKDTMARLQNVSLTFLSLINCGINKHKY